MFKITTTILCVTLVLGARLTAVKAEKNCLPTQRTSSQPGNTSQRSSPGKASEPVLDGSEIQISYAQRGQTLTVYVGRTIAVRLPGSTDVGHWEVTSLTGNGVKSLGKSQYVPNRDNPDRLPGAYIFKFEANQLGRAKLKMLYHSPEQEKKKNARPNTFHVEFLVRNPPEKKK